MPFSKPRRAVLLEHIPAVEVAVPVEVVVARRWFTDMALGMSAHGGCSSIVPLWMSAPPRNLELPFRGAAVRA